MITRLLVANRGEIARRVFRTARRMGIATVAVYSDADANALHVHEADAAVRLGPAPRDSYLSIESLLAATRASGADAVHPGYGFLAENDAFAQAVIDAGLAWVGPPPAAIRAMGDKAAAKQLARRIGVPVLPGYDDADPSDAALASAADRIGYPLLVKASSGGGGRGMRLVRAPDDLQAALTSARSEARTAFGDDRVILERALESARHVEVQVFADRHGGCVHLGERDCSVQRRHQKLIEESPSPAVDATLRARMGASAVQLARAVGYVGAGTLEFLLDDEGRYWFMEMNTRLQVEHPVTEMVTGLDLVEWQLRVARGEPLPRSQDEITLAGHAIEVRLCCEDAGANFVPQTGTITRWEIPARALQFEAMRDSPALRVDAGVSSGSEVSPWYDSMIAKVIVHAPDRTAANSQLSRTRDQLEVFSFRSNRAWLARELRDAVFADPGARIDFVTTRATHLAAPVPDEATIALAGALLVAERGRRVGFGELACWSSNPAHETAVRLLHGSEQHDIAIRHLHADGAVMHVVRVDGKQVPIRIDANDGTTASVRIGDVQAVRFTVPFHVTDDTIELHVRGERWPFRDTTHVPSLRRGAGGLSEQLLAPMNAKVVAVHAAPDAAVEAGRPLVVLEAMKMEHVLSAPVAVRVTAVHVSAGAQVKPGQLLLELAPAT